MFFKLHGCAVFVVLVFGLVVSTLCLPPVSASQEEMNLLEISDDEKPWVYWFWKNGNISREGITADLEAMHAVGIGGMIVMEVSLSVPPGPVSFFSEAWRELFAHAVREADRLGLKICINSAPGWTGSGGPWITPELSMKKVVASERRIKGPSRRDVVLKLPETVQGFYRDSMVLAFPTPEPGARIDDIDEKALYKRGPFSSAPDIRPHFSAVATYPHVPIKQCIDREQVLDLSGDMDASGRLVWEVPEGRWTVMRIGYTSTGQTNRPAPLPGLECDKLDPTALEAHFDAYIRKLVEDAGPHAGKALTGTHFDSWEVGGQNWTEHFPQAFLERRGYDLSRYLPVMLGYVVESLEISERFLWDLRQTVSEMIAEYHGRHMRDLAHACGLTLSIEPYDMTPCDNMTLGAAADIPMCEFWSDTFDTRYSVREAVSIAHVYGRPVVAAEAFTSVDKWLLHPGAIKANGDWAFCEGVNKMVIHRYIHQPFAQARPGLSLGPHGLHYERTQTWWEYTGPWHAYLARCQSALRNVPVADLLYLSPEGAPNVFQGPDPAPAGYLYDACTPEALLSFIEYRDGFLTNGKDARYRLLILPDTVTMTPALLTKIKSLVHAGATIVGPPPLESPSLSGYPRCDQEVKEIAGMVWQGERNTDEIREQCYGAGRVLWGGTLAPPSPLLEQETPVGQSNWIWCSEETSALAASPGRRYFVRTVNLDQLPDGATIFITADNAFRCWVNGEMAGHGETFQRIFEFTITELLLSGENRIAVEVENSGDDLNPAGLVAAVSLKYADGGEMVIITDESWKSASTAQEGWRTDGALTALWSSTSVVGPMGMAPWGSIEVPAPRVTLYPPSAALEPVLKRLGIAPDFVCGTGLRFIHQLTPQGDLYFVSNGGKDRVEDVCIFRIKDGLPVLLHPEDGSARVLPQYTWLEDGRTAVPLVFEADESYFILFRNGPVSDNGINGKTNFPPKEEVLEVEGPWQVHFDDTLGGPDDVVWFERLEDWASHANKDIRHYSGTAVYTCDFDMPAETLESPKSLFLDLGRVEVTARVRLNNQDLGIAWKFPYRVPLGNTIHSGENQLEIRVANLWVNRMIGDDGLPPDSPRKPDGTLKAWPRWLLEGNPSPSRRISFATWRHWTREDALQPSGLLGPVIVYRQ